MRYQPRLKKDLPVEPVTVNEDRFSLESAKYPQFDELYMTQRNQEWFETEIDFSKDWDSWNTLSKDEQFFYKNTLATFANADQIVLANVAGQLVNELHHQEMICNLAFQSHMEAIHARTYKAAIETLIRDPEERIYLFRSILTNPIVKPKMEWSMMWLDPEVALADRLVAWTCVEGLFFASSFASLNYARSKGILPGVSYSNEFIASDEALHCVFSSMVYRECKNQLTTDDIHELVGSAVDIECEFVRQSLPYELPGMNADLMQEHVKSQADVLFKLLGHDPFYKVKTPFGFMFGFGLDGKTNFFERRVPDYVKSDASALKEAKVENAGDDLD